MVFEMFCEQQSHSLDSSLSFTFFFLPKLFLSILQALSPSCNVVNFITAEPPLEHEEQNVALLAPLLQMHPDPIKLTSQCAAMAAVVVGMRTALLWLLTCEMAGQGEDNGGKPQVS